MKTKIDTLTDQLSNPTLLLKDGKKGAVKGQGADLMNGGTVFDKTCLVFKKPGHGVGWCLKNWYMGQRCANCRNKEHKTETYWSKKKVKPEIKDAGVHLVFSDDDNSSSSDDEPTTGSDGFNCELLRVFFDTGIGSVE